MEDLAQSIEEIRRNTYDKELADIYIKELLGMDKEYD